MKTQTVPAGEQHKIYWTNSTGSNVAAGGVVNLGNRYGIAAVDIANGASGIVYTEGRFTVAKASGTALSQGRGLGWDAANSRIDTSIAAGKFGEVAVAALSADLTVEVNLTPVRRVYSAFYTPTAGEDTANQVDFTTGFGVAPTGALIVQIINASNVIRNPAGAVTVDTPTAGKIRVIDAGLTASERINIIAFE